MDVLGLAEKAAEAAQRSGESPVALAGRLVGLGAAEQRAGVPKWAWLGVGLVAGGALMWVFGDDLRRRLGGSS